MDPASPVFRRVAAGSHADLLTVEREWDDKKSRLRGEIVVDDARAVSAFLRLTPAEGGWRVVVIDGAEHLNRNAANAVLKMLEEPPPRAVLLLTCAAPGRLLPTIRSRCRRLALHPLDAREMAHALAEYLPDTPPRSGPRWPSWPPARPAARCCWRRRRGCSSPPSPRRCWTACRACPSCARSPSPSSWAAGPRTASPRS